MPSHDDKPSAYTPTHDAQLAFFFPVHAARHSQPRSPRRTGIRVTRTSRPVQIAKSVPEPLQTHAPVKAPPVPLTAESLAVLAPVRVVHYRDTRLMVNAGMPFPACYANPANYLLDISKSGLPSTPITRDVTCKHCQKIVKNTNLARFAKWSD